ncbi:hypothetical protein [uncultured Clostridium sp.]|uniref:hypothetical protein n=1 Tax=uncultured Clostridium sp. TaxID=59620 RepID=UPI00258798C7|nr:hypothetical protein [uncultured Clostridium sp.]
MKICQECGHRFTVLEEFKALNRKNSEIKCSKCGTIYRKNLKLIIGISIFLTVIISSLLGDKIKEQYYSAHLLVIGASAACICYMLIVLLSIFMRYRKIN